MTTSLVPLRFKGLKMPFKMNMQLSISGSGICDESIVSLNIHETVPANEAPAAYLRRRLLEEFDRKFKSLDLPSQELLETARERREQ